MSTKLTLTIDKSVIEQAKKYAKSEGRSLSNLIEDYLKTVVGQNASSDELELSPTVKSLLGAVKLENIKMDHKDILGEELLKKYLK